jgi:hypothetical protein
MMSRTIVITAGASQKEINEARSRADYVASKEKCVVWVDVASGQPLHGPKTVYIVDGRPLRELQLAVERGEKVHEAHCGSFAAQSLGHPGSAIACALCPGSLGWMPSTDRASGSTAGLETR